MSILYNQIVYKMDGMSSLAGQIEVGHKLGQNNNVVKTIETYKYCGKIITFHNDFELFSCTPDQYIAVADWDGFIEAEDIKKGDLLVQCYKGIVNKPLVIKKITRSDYKGDVYNFDLTGDKTYNICGILVHN